VATRVLADWLNTFGSTATGEGVQEAATRLEMGGMRADEAIRMAGPAILLRAGGVEGLVRAGVGRRTAYRWRAAIDAAVPPEVWAETLGIPLTLSDAVTADQFCERLS
jgi:hypothetical protein